MSDNLTTIFHSQDCDDLVAVRDEDDTTYPIGINEGRGDELWSWLSEDEALELATAIQTSLGKTAESVDESRVYAGDIPLNEALLRLAALNEREVEFRYAKGKGGVIETRTLKPSKLIPMSDHVTFVGHDPDRDDVRAYRVDRIVGTAVIR